MLELKNLNAGYGEIGVLWDLSLTVKKGEFVSIIGPNGVGKTTTLRAIAGMLTPTKGSILFQGDEIIGTPPHKLNRKGISFTTGGGNLFNGMTVRENLNLGAFTINSKSKTASLLEKLFELFPRLKEREAQLAGTLSGGEQKMLSLARGLMSDPQLLLVDEPSLGLAPNLVLAVFETLKILKESGVTILLVEQNVNSTLRITDRTYVLEQGEVALEGPSYELLENEHVKNSYLGVA